MCDVCPQAQNYQDATESGGHAPIRRWRPRMLLTASCPDGGIGVESPTVSPDLCTLLTPELGSQFARMALANIVREYPAKLDHVINGPDDVRAPSILHPRFHGSFDWHSCVHMHWMLARLLRLLPEEDFVTAIREQFRRRFTVTNVAGEVDYLRQNNRRAFERTYGLAWLVELAPEAGPRQPGGQLREAFCRMARHAGTAPHRFCRLLSRLSTQGTPPDTLWSA